MHVPAFYRFDPGQDAKLVHPGKAKIHLHAGHNSNIARPENAFSLRMTGPTEPFSIGGFDGPVDGHTLRFYNAEPCSVTVVNRDPQTSEYYRIDTLAGGDVTFPGPCLILFEYDALSRAWILATPRPFTAVAQASGVSPELAAILADMSHMFNESQVGRTHDATASANLESRLANVELFIDRVQSQLRKSA